MIGHRSERRTAESLRRQWLLPFLAGLLCAAMLFPAVSVSGDETAASLTVYYIDVGQAEAALVICEGHTLLIDGGLYAGSSKIRSLLETLQITYLDYVIATHAHDDHVGGLAAALSAARAGAAYSPVLQYNSPAFRRFTDLLSQQEVGLTVPQHGSVVQLGSAEVHFLGPIRPTVRQNDLSVVVKVVYGAVSFLFTGDAEAEEERDIVEAGYDLSAAVLQVAHHGHRTSTSLSFLQAVSPEYAVISCGKGNGYGCPHPSVLSRLNDIGATVYRTDLSGTIRCDSDGISVTFTAER